MNADHLNIAAIVQARMKSSRLPGKVLMEVLDKPLLYYLLQRLKDAKTLKRIIVATTLKEEDQPIVKLAEEWEFEVFRGEEHDVMARFLNTCRTKGIDVCVRITADCPLIDPEIVDKIVTYFLQSQENLDYASNVIKRTYPRGMDVEIFSFMALERAYISATHAEKEHVTLHMIRHPEKFRLGNIESEVDLSTLRLTVDTKEDFRLIAKIIEVLYPLQPHFKLPDILKTLSLYPQWLEWNAHVNQKVV
jgi:spore coat polysaccharide biosynthesis protein SpsF